MKTVDSPYAGYVGYERDSSTGAASVYYTVEVSRDGPLFCSFPTEYPLSEAEIQVNGKTVGRAYTEKGTGINDGDGNEIKSSVPNSYYLGTFSAGEEVSVVLSFGRGRDGTVLYIPEGIDFIFEVDETAVKNTFALLSAGTDGLNVSGESIIVSSPIDTNLTAVVSTLPSSSVNVSGGDGKSFLGVFAAAQADENEETVLSPSVASDGLYALSLFGIILLAFVLFCESMTEKGLRLPFFSLSAGREPEFNEQEKGTETVEENVEENAAENPEDTVKENQPE